jgi:hypothetical protein
MRLDFYLKRLSYNEINFAKKEEFEKKEGNIQNK